MQMRSWTSEKTQPTVGGAPPGQVSWVLSESELRLQ